MWTVCFQTAGNWDWFGKRQYPGGHIYGTPSVDGKLPKWMSTEEIRSMDLFKPNVSQESF